MQNNKQANELRLLVSKLDADGRYIVSTGADLAYRSKHEFLDIPHVLSVLVSQEDSLHVGKLESRGILPSKLKKEVRAYLEGFKASSGGIPPTFSEKLIRVLRAAWLEVSLKGEDAVITVSAILDALVRDEGFESLCLEIPELRKFSRPVGQDSGNGGQDAVSFVSDEDNYSSLKKYTIDLTAKAQTANIDPVVGRDSEIAQVVEILLRRRQNNPILVGEAGVGKTAIVEGLAQRIVAGLVPEAMKGVRLLTLDMGLLKAGASMRGEIELRLKSIISEIVNSPQKIVLFIDEIHTIVGGGAGGEQNDIANLIKPELARGSLRTIGATTWAEYKRYFEKDAALSRRFQTIRVNEPSVEDAKDILQGLLPSLQHHHRVYITQSAIDAAVTLSSRYMQGRQLPDKAISVLDTACARAVAFQTGPATALLHAEQRKVLLMERLNALQREQVWSKTSQDSIEEVQDALKHLEDELLELGQDQLRMVKKAGDMAQLALVQTSLSGEEETTILSGQSQTQAVPLTAKVEGEDVAAVVADWTGIPSQKMMVDQYNIVSRLEEALSGRVIGQKAAIHIICDKIRAFTAKLHDPSRPMGVFMLAGTSGVGKTETAHALADVFFATSGMTVVNMSEYQEAHTVSKLKGAPAGYVGYGQGGVLTEAIRRRPYGLLLLDEIEKAHSDVMNLFMQVFDKGFMEDSEGVRVDFKNTLVIMTTNAGTDVLEELTQEKSLEYQNDLPPGLQDSLLRHFAPAFLGRTHVVPYYPLGSVELKAITGLKLRAVCDRFHLAYKKNLSYDVSLLDFIVEKALSKTIGARWVDQYISKSVTNNLATYVLDTLAAGRSIGNSEIAAIDGLICVREV